MARKFTYYPSSYVRANILSDMGYSDWKASEATEQGNIVYSKKVPEIDCIFYITEKPRGYKISFWFPSSDKYTTPLSGYDTVDATNLKDAVELAEDKIEQYKRIYSYN